MIYGLIKGFIFFVDVYVVIGIHYGNFNFIVKQFMQNIFHVFFSHYLINS